MGGDVTAILSGSSPSDCGAVVSVIRKSRITHDRLYVPLRRPWGGWNARQWRREVLEWGALAALVVSSWASLNLLVATVEVVVR